MCAHAGTPQSSLGSASWDTTTYEEAFYNLEFNPAFVQMKYFGYMRRDPAGWLGKLNQYGNYLDGEMVKSFIISPNISLALVNRKLVNSVLGFSPARFV